MVNDRIFSAACSLVRVRLSCRTSVRAHRIWPSPSSAMSLLVVPQAYLGISESIVPFALSEGLILRVNVDGVRLVEACAFPA